MRPSLFPVALVACVTLCLFSLVPSASASTQGVTVKCPKVDGSGFAECDSFTDWDVDNCYKKCCKSTGKCHSSSCEDTFNTPNARANCNKHCQEKYTCIPESGACNGNTQHCLGKVGCALLPNGQPHPECSAQKEGLPCLYDGFGTAVKPKTMNFKICDPSGPDDGGFMLGDPEFVGLKGQRFQIHGVAGQVYNIISDEDLQYNSRFVFLDSGDCPVVNGRKLKGCWSHPGSFLGELGLKTKAGDRIRIVSGKAKDGFDSVTINDKDLEIGESVLLNGDMGSVIRNNTHVLQVQVGNWDIAFENSDQFVNQRVRVFDSKKVRSHGLFGQTWKDKTYPNAIKHIEGSVDDYVVRQGEVFGDDFVFNQFN